MRSPWIFSVLVLLAGCGTKQENDPGTDAGTFAISTESIASGQVGAAYRQQLAASGGTAPYGWTIGSKSPELAWLHIGAVSGMLTGSPTESVTGARVTVVATDQRADTGTREFTLNVTGCQPGDTASCFYPGGAGECRAGVVACDNGTYPSTCAGSPSTDVSACGVACTPCGANANACVDGICACGAGSACGAGAICCGGTCVSQDDPRNCGACGNDCTAQAGSNVAVSCAGGQCSFACQAGYLNCAWGSTPKDGCPVHVAADVQNCGACNHACSTDSNTANAPTCESGVCRITCHPSRLDCDNSPENGCEVARTTANCSRCGDACHPAGTDNVAAPQCVVSGGAYTCSPLCNNGYANCDGVDSNGCERAIVVSVSNCGACGYTCPSFANTAIACQSGQCVVTSCPSGWRDCDNNAANGCEKAPNPCGCGCPAGYGCGDTGCEPCVACGGVACCPGGCTYCVDIGRVMCGGC